MMRGSLGAIPQGRRHGPSSGPDLSSVRASREHDRERIGIVFGQPLPASDSGPNCWRPPGAFHGVAWNAAFYVRDPGVTFISALAPVSP